MATTYGYIYDLEGENSTYIAIEGQQKFIKASFSPDGVHLFAVHWDGGMADT